METSPYGHWPTANDYKPAGTHFLQLHINRIIILWLQYHQCSVGLSNWQEPVQSKQQEASSVNTYNFNNYLLNK